MQIKIYRNDALPAIGAYLRPDGPPDEEPMIIVNVPFCFGEFVDEDGNDIESSSEDKKRIFIETIMHEFGHVLEHHLSLEPNEEAIEAACTSF